MADPQLDPDFSERVLQLQRFLRERGLDTRVGSAYRPPEEQDRLYAQGRTARGPIVTYAPRYMSYHQYGKAADLDPEGGMPEGRAAEVLAQVLRENPQLGLKGIGAWDPFHVQTTTPLSQLSPGGPLVAHEGPATGSPAGLPTQATEKPPEALMAYGPSGPPGSGIRPQLAYGALEAAAPDFWTQAMLASSRKSALDSMAETLRKMGTGMQRPGVRNA